ncbi:MAG TPA: hypothetical protein VMW17_10555 [Candidatus Binatia bacterium]|nr:hypothetical protein [Candidatus Binatia bacterium]
MNDIAQLSYKGGGIILSAQTPYERELLVECIEATTRRHGPLVLHVSGRHWSIRISDGVHPACVSCSQWPSHLAYPGGSSGTLVVVSSRAAPCTKLACGLAQGAVNDRAVTN